MDAKKELAAIKKEKERKDRLIKQFIMLIFVTLGTAMYLTAASGSPGYAALAGFGMALFVIGILQLMG